MSKRPCLARITLVLALVVGAALQAGAWQMMEEEVGPAFALGGVVAISDPASAQMSLLFGADTKDNPSQYYLLELKGRSLSLSRADGQKSTPLVRPVELPAMAKDQKVDFALHRDAWGIAFVWDGTVVLEAYDTELHGGVVGHEASGGAKIDDAWLQDVGEIDVVDTFEREEGAKDEWEQLSGKWQLISLREDRQAGQMRAELSANAFSYFGSSETSALCAMGSWFWRKADYSVSVRAREDTPAVGLAFYVQDKDNYMLLRWQGRYSSSAQAPRLQLFSVVKGQRKLLAEKLGGYLPYQWYKLQVRACDGRFVCLVDGEVWLQATSTAFGQGKIGMYVEGKNGAWFDDMCVVGWQNMVEDFEQPAPGKWRPERGTWQVAGGAAKPTSTASSLLVAGSPEWSSYGFTATVDGRQGGRGLAVCCGGPDTGYVFRWAPKAAKVPYAGKAQIVTLGATEQVISEAVLPADMPSSVTATVAVERDYLACALNGRRLVDAVVQGPLKGAVGLYAEGDKSVSFGFARVDALPPRSVARVTKEYTDTEEHYEMAEWSSTRHAWVKPADSDNPKVWWTKGDWYGPLEVSFELPKIGEVEGTMKVSLEAEKGDPKTGAQLAISGTKGSHKLLLSLTADGKELGKAEVEAEGDTCHFSFGRRGSRVLVMAQDKVAINVVWP